MGFARCVIMTFTNVIGMATLIFGVSYATQKGYGIGYSSSEFLRVTTLVANVAAVVSIPLFGALSDRMGRRGLMVAGGIGGGLLAGDTCGQSTRGACRWSSCA